MNQAISKILSERHVNAHMHTPSHIIITIIIVKQAAKNSNITQEQGDYTKFMLSFLDKLFVCFTYLRRQKHILVIALKNLPRSST